MNAVDASRGREIVQELVDVIVENRSYLSEVDGAIGDGDHGINMAKGFRQCGEEIADRALSLSEALESLSDMLMDNIGGSMGPLYGSFFMGMSEAVEDADTVDADTFARMLEEGLDSLRTVSEAGVGDKCLMDTLVPAARAAREAVDAGKPFQEVLAATRNAAEAGRDSTRDLVARIGRAARLGERSKGVLDAGATSACLLVCRLADALEKRG